MISKGPAEVYIRKIYINTEMVKVIFYVSKKELTIIMHTETRGPWATSLTWEKVQINKHMIIS